MNVSVWGSNFVIFIFVHNGKSQTKELAPEGANSFLKEKIPFWTDFVPLSGTLKVIKEKIPFWTDFVTLGGTLKVIKVVFL